MIRDGNFERDYTTKRDGGVHYSYGVRWGSDAQGKTAWAALVYLNKRHVGTVRGTLEGRGNGYDSSSVDTLIADAVRQYIERGEFKTE